MSGETGLQKSCLHASSKSRVWSDERKLKSPTSHLPRKEETSLRQCVLLVGCQIHGEREGKN